MKKLILLTATLIGINGVVQATTITAPSSLNVLEGSDAYSWGISIAVPTGESITSAQISFNSVDLVASGNQQGTGTLYVDLLNSKSTGVTTATDNDATGDYWATQFSGSKITSLGSEFFKSVNTTLTWTDTLTTSELAALNSYVSGNDGLFNIGLDPDCKFTDSSITFTYTLGGTHNSVPDAATTALMLVLGLGGVELFRRSFSLAKAKA